jgi:hypothetical protein
MSDETCRPFDKRAIRITCLCDFHRRLEFTACPRKTSVMPITDQQAI